MEIKIVKSIRRSISITVYRSCLVKICAPIWLSDKKIQSFIEEKRNWIERKLEKFKNNPQKEEIELKYETGEMIYFFGNGYKIEIVDAKKNAIIVENGQFLIYKKESASAKKIVEKWMLNQAKDIFLEIIEVNFAVFSKEFPCNFPSLKIRKMKSRWGSMSSKGLMTLNVKLVEKPMECIDYVVMHELCHIKHQNHSKSFYDLQAKFTPNYKQIKAKLNNQA